MNGNISAGITFADDIRSFNFTSGINMTVHLLCLEGSFSFTRSQIRFNVSAGDYVILTPRYRHY